MLLVFERVELWGPFVTGLRPRRWFTVLVKAGAYQAGLEEVARIQVQ